MVSLVAECWRINRLALARLRSIAHTSQLRAQSDGFSLELNNPISFLRIPHKKSIRFFGKQCNKNQAFRNSNCTLDSGPRNNPNIDSEKSDWHSSLTINKDRSVTIKLRRRKNRDRPSLIKRHCIYRVAAESRLRILHTEVRSLQSESL